MAQEGFRLAISAPDYMSDDIPSPLHLIQANIFERIREELWDQYSK